jgi:hypothetical protein
MIGLLIGVIVIVMAVMGICIYSAEQRKRKRNDQQQLATAATSNNNSSSSKQHQTLRHASSGTSLGSGIPIDTITIIIEKEDVEQHESNEDRPSNTTSSSAMQQSRECNQRMTPLGLFPEAEDTNNSNDVEQ